MDSLVEGSHRCYYATYESVELTDRERLTVSLQDCFSSEKLDESGITLDDILPNTAHKDVVPTGIFEASGDGSAFDQITDNIKKLSQATFLKQIMRAGEIISGRRLR